MVMLISDVELEVVSDPDEVVPRSGVVVTTVVPEVTSEVVPNVEVVVEVKGKVVSRTEDVVVTSEVVSRVDTIVDVVGTSTVVFEVVLTRPLVADHFSNSSLFSFWMPRGFASVSARIAAKIARVWKCIVNDCIWFQVFVFVMPREIEWYRTGKIVAANSIRFFSKERL